MSHRPNSESHRNPVHQNEVPPRDTQADIYHVTLNLVRRNRSFHRIFRQQCADQLAKLFVGMVMPCHTEMLVDVF